MKLGNILIAVCLCAAHCGLFAQSPYPYLNPAVPVEKRVDDLMSRMTLDDKIAQMTQFVGLEHMRQAEKSVTEEELLNGHARGFYKGLHSSGVERMVTQGRIGSFLHVLTAEEANHLQTLAERSPLKIPLLIGIDAIHGNGLYCGSTIYPSPIGTAATFAPSLLYEASRQTAAEMRATGSHWAFAPNIEVAADARWGRVGESFGEDPYLISVMGVAAVQGLQGDGFGGKDDVIACAKHLLGGGVANNGTNAAPVELSEREMRNVFLPPFKRVIEQSKPYTIMPAHNEVNGMPCHCNSHLIDDIIRKEYKFDGFVVSDWMDMEAIGRRHRLAESDEEAFRLSVDAGVDMHMHGPGFAEAVKSLVESGKLDVQRVDDACRKILYAKFKLGLFENRYVDTTKISTALFTPEHRRCALDIARRSIVLLKNSSLLPLPQGKYKKILVTGPNADNQSIMGDWVFRQPDDNVTTIYEGIRDMAVGATVKMADVGWNLREISERDVAMAVKEAKHSDLAIVVVGEDSFREHWTEKTCGENRDRADITLWGRQQELVERIYATGTPTVVVFVNGRPLATEWIADNIDAVLEAWEPGSMGGQAVAEILFGEVNPSGRLPITIPRSVGQIKTVYNHKPSQYLHPVIDCNRTPLYPFGYGLSYTKFGYSNLRLSKSVVATTESLVASVDVRNIGSCAGEEVVQLYIADDYSTATRPVKELKDFRRVALQPSESATVEFEITPEMLSYYDYNSNFVLEKGGFTIMVGSSSDDKSLSKIKLNVK